MMKILKNNESSESCKSQCTRKETCMMFQEKECIHSKLKNIFSQTGIVKKNPLDISSKIKLYLLKP